MDVSAFIQENKRWLLGCLLGLVVFFVGRSVVSAMYDPAPVRAQAFAAVSSLPREVYANQTLQALESEAVSLESARRQLEEALAFKQGKTYRLEGQAMAPDQYLGKVGRDLKLRIQRAAAERDVEVKERRGLSWPSATKTDEIRAVLFGLELLDEATQRLFAAHDAVRAADTQAMGLMSISFVIDEQRQGRNVRRRRDEVDPAEGLQMQQVQFEIEADEQTVMRFLESLRVPGRTLALAGEGLVWTRPQQVGDPTKVKGRLLGVAFKEEE
jgi:hypothetical protein